VVTIYRSGLTDSTRWDDFEFRAGDIVISTPSKCGTTWTQLMCALLVFGTPELPVPLTVVSPWLDMALRPLPEVVAQVGAQRHRRILKTHTPLDGIPDRADVTFLVVGRHPLDVGVSLHHHVGNLRRERIAAIRGDGPPEQSGAPAADVREAVMGWIAKDVPPTVSGASLRAMVWHLERAWRRRDDSNVVLLHYSDLLRDLDGEFRRLAVRLGEQPPEGSWPALVEAASLQRMRERPEQFVPDERTGIFADPHAFFRHGGNGQWEGVLAASDVRIYQRQLRRLGADGDFHRWLHHGTARTSPLPARPGATPITRSRWWIS
jgi:hypothetical protein